MMCAMNLALCGFAALAVAMGIGRFAFTPILPMMREDFGFGLAEGGWLASANYVGYFVGALSAMAVRVRAGHAIRAGLAAVAISTLAMGLAADLGAWLLLRFVAGVASAWVLLYCSAACLQRFHETARADRHGRILGAIVFAGVGGGIALAGVACMALQRRGADAATAWILLGVLSLAAVVPVARRFDGLNAVAAPARAGGGGADARLVICYGLFGLGYIIPATFLPAMARDILPESPLYGLSWPLFGLAAAASTLLVAARIGFGDRALWISSQLAMAAGVAWPVFQPGLGGIAVSAVLVGGTFMVATMAGMQEARRIGGANARALMAAMTCAFAAGQIAGPLLVAALAGHAGGYNAALMFGAAALVASSLALVRPRASRRTT